MHVREATSADDLAAYHRWVLAHPEGSLWQSLEWRAFQEQRGRRTRLFLMAREDGGIAGSALAIIDQTSFGLCTWDIPRGPLIAASGLERTDVATFLTFIRAEAKKAGCYALYFSPSGSFASVMGEGGSTPSPRHEQPDATIVIDLRQSEEELLQQMHQKGRYNIGVARRHGVNVEQSADVKSFHALVRETGQRDGFTPNGEDHYRAFLRCLPGSFLLLAHAPGRAQPVAGLIGVAWNGRGIYYYGASSHAQRALMAPALLQWEAMRLCRQQGCAIYDLFGIATSGAVGHPLSGVTDFKSKFGGTVVMYEPERRLLLRPFAAALLRMKRRLMG